MFVCSFSKSVITMDFEYIIMVIFFFWKFVCCVVSSFEGVLYLLKFINIYSRKIF